MVAQVSDSPVSRGSGSRAVGRAMIADNQIVRIAIPARHALDRDRQPGHVGLHQIDHAIDGGLVAGRALGLDPALDTGNHRLDIDGLMFWHHSSNHVRPRASTPLRLLE